MSDVTRAGLIEAIVRARDNLPHGPGDKDRPVRAFVSELIQALKVVEFIQSPRTSAVVPENGDGTRIEDRAQKLEKMLVERVARCEEGYRRGGAEGYLVQVNMGKWVLAILRGTDPPTEQGMPDRRVPARQALDDLIDELMKGLEEVTRRTLERTRSKLWTPDDATSEDSTDDAPG